MKKIKFKSQPLSLEDKKLLEMVSKKLIGRVLFPKKVEEARRLVENMRWKHQS